MNAKFLNIKGTLIAWEHPVVMGILNITPDSFYAGSRKQDEKAITERIEAILAEGGGIIDVGGYSSRPDAIEVSAEEEWNRLAVALSILRSHYTGTVVSIDTFRASIARRAVEDYGVSIINDISGGDMDPEMFPTVAALNVPYILMHMRGTPQTMASRTDYNDLVEDIILNLAQKIRQLHLLGVNDIIVDPGFGFSKTLDQNYTLMRELRQFEMLELPLLVGISRKRMISNLLNINTEESLNGTTVLNTYALLQGADILRVHDVRAAAEAIRIVEKLRESSDKIFLSDDLGTLRH